MSWAFFYSRLVSISGGKIPGYFSPEMNVEEMYLASSRKKVFLKCYLFYIRLFPLISSQSSVVQTVTASFNTELQHSKSLQICADGHWGLSDPMSSGSGNLMDLWKAVKFWFEGTIIIGVFWHVMAPLADPRRDLRPVMPCTSLWGQMTVGVRSSSVRISEAMYLVLSALYTYCFGGKEIKSLDGKP